MEQLLKVQRLEYVGGIKSSVFFFFFFFSPPEERASSTMQPKMFVAV